MAIQLVRRPGVGVDPSDAEASRAWVMAEVREQIRGHGEPHPRIYLLGDGFLETLDLLAVHERDPGADLGATFQLLRRRGGVGRCWLVVGVQGQDLQGAERSWAAIFEERDTSDGRRWWMALLGYRVDPKSGVGLPDARWQQPPGETGDPAQVLPFFRPIASPPPGARPAEIAEPSDTWRPDLRFTFGEVPEGQPIPVDAKQMVEFAAALSVRDLLSGAITGAVVVRLVGRAWEAWILGDDMPADIHEMIRWIANHRLPAAEGVALAQLVIRPQDDPPIPGVQIMAEFAGQLVESWAPIAFPSGPDGPREIPAVHWRQSAPVGDEGRWLGVASKAELSEPGFD